MFNIGIEQHHTAKDVKLTNAGIIIIIFFLRVYKCLMMNTCFSWSNRTYDIHNTLLVIWLFRMFN